MPMNKQIDLDNHLFAQLERLDDDSLGPDALKAEIARSKAIAGIAAQINASRANSLRAAQILSDEGPRAKLPEGF